MGVPILRDPDWAQWLGRFPAQPDHDRYELEWTRHRLGESLAAIPSVAALSRIDKDRVIDWLADYAHDFELECGRDIEIWDPVSVAGVFTILIGTLAAPLVPPISIGAFVASAFLLWHGILQRMEDRACDRTEREIKRLLRVLRQMVR